VPPTRKCLSPNLTYQSVTSSAKTILFAFAIGIPTAFLLGRHLSTSLAHLIILSFIFSGIVYLTHSTLAPLIVSALSLALLALVIEVVRASTRVKLSFELTVAGLFVLIAFLTWLSTRRFHKKLDRHDVFQNLLTVLLIWFLTRSATWDLQNALSVVSATQEDNGTWLDGISRIMQRDGAVNTDETVLGGSIGSIVGSLVVGSSLRIGRLSNTHLDTPLILLNTYWILTTSIALIASRITHALTRGVLGVGSVVPALVSASGVILYAKGIHTVGHFTALLAGTYLALTLVLLIEPTFGRTSSLAFTFGAVWATASAWFPLYALTIFVFGVSVVVGMISIWKTSETLAIRKLRDGSKNLLQNRRQIIGLGAGALTLAVVGNEVLLPIVKVFVDVEYVRYNLFLQGGYAVVHSYVLLSTIILSLVAISQLNSQAVLVRMTRVLTICIIMFLVGLVAVSFVWSPNDPQYGTYKTAHLVGMVLMPLAIAGLSALAFRLLKSKIHAAFAVGALFVIGALTYLEPYPQIKQLLQSPAPAWWVTAAAQELSENPQRLVLCLDTRGENWAGYSAYVCSRQLAGIQGRTSYETNTWTAANICTVSSDQVASLPREFWSELTLIVTDPQRLVNSNTCDGFGWAGPDMPQDEKYPIGWLSGVDWNAVRIVGPEGQLGTKSFAYLLSETGFTEATVAKLEASLNGS